MTSSEQEAVKFLAALGYSVEDVGPLEIRLIGGRAVPLIFFKFDFEAIQKANQDGANVYFGVAHRDGRGGKTENVTYATTLWADIDGKDWDQNNYDDGKTAALEHLKKEVPSELAPSIVVDSGHGYHVYWLLRSPYAFSSDDRRAEFTSTLERLSLVLKGDRRVKDISRILRLPGTMNTKDAEHRLCSIIHWAPDNLYDFDAVARWAGSAAPKPKGKQDKTRHSDFSRDLDIAIQALPRLSTARVDDYESWIAVGMALHSISSDTDQADILLALWDNWSRRSSKYHPGECAEKWESFSLDRNQVLTIDSLMKWANEDSGQRIIVPGGRNPKPSQILKALTDMGYEFRQNDMNDMIFVSGTPLSDGLKARIIVRLNENKYRNNQLAEYTWTAEAYDNKFHPIQSHLEDLEWDHVSRFDMIGRYVLDEDGLFPVLLRAWMIGAVGKILGSRKGQHHPMLVLDGSQGIGKSRFVWWLGSILPQFYVASPINPDDKDFLIRQCSMFVWEVEELGSTFRRSDREALKAFMSREFVNIRKPYGRYDIQKPVTASYIGTINNEGGFLTDPTGNRRFRICTVAVMDWNYCKDIDINQLWAEAVWLHRSGVSSDLDKANEEIITGKNDDYLAEDPIETILWNIYEVTGNPNHYVRIAEIISEIRGYNVGIDMNMVNSNRIAAILTRSGIRRKRVNVEGYGGRPVWIGLARRDEPLPMMSSLDITRFVK